MRHALTEFLTWTHGWLCACQMRWGMFLHAYAVPHVHVARPRCFWRGASQPCLARPPTSFSPPVLGSWLDPVWDIASECVGVEIYELARDWSRDRISYWKRFWFIARSTWWYACVRDRWAMKCARCSVWYIISTFMKKRDKRFKWCIHLLSTCMQLSRAVATDFISPLSTPLTHTHHHTACCTTASPDATSPFVSRTSRGKKSVTHIIICITSGDFIRF